MPALRRCGGLFGPTPMLRVRLPLIRRPRERPWEILNLRDFGSQEGTQNWRMYTLMLCFTSAVIAFEAYRELTLIFLRGDTCEACELARKQYKARQAAKERQLGELESHIANSKMNKQQQLLEGQHHQGQQHA